MFFRPYSDDRCYSVDSGSAIQLGPSMIRMLGPSFEQERSACRNIGRPVPHRYRHETPSYTLAPASPLGPPLSYYALGNLLRQTKMRIPLDVAQHSEMISPTIPI